ncbi:MAG: hypothetical protein ACT6U0_23595 [Shinella sp.]|uniref:hypothetical protein n=1 Tax=Shinella sp. TaxID=1870904 RepID=UPI004036CECA
MRRFVLVSIALATAVASFATPSLAQKSGRGDNGGDRGSNGRGEYFRTVEREPITHVRKKHRVILANSGAYCSTNWAVLFDKSGHRTKVRHCDDRLPIDVR